MTTAPLLALLLALAWIAITASPSATLVHGASTPSSTAASSSSLPDGHPCNRVVYAQWRNLLASLSNASSSSSPTASGSGSGSGGSKNRKLKPASGSSSSSPGNELFQAKFAVAVLSPDGIHPVQLASSASSSSSSSSSSSGGEGQQQDKDVIATDSLLSAVSLRYVDAAHMLVSALQKLGHDAILTSRFDLNPANYSVPAHPSAEAAAASGLDQVRQYIVLGAHHLLDPAGFPQASLYQDLAAVQGVLDTAILFNLELVDSTGDQHITPEYLNLLKGKCVWDSSSINAARLTQLGQFEHPILHVALPFAPWLNTEYRGIYPAGGMERDVDVLYLGKVTTRAREILTLVQQQGINVYAIEGGESDLEARERDALIARAKLVVLLHSADASATDSGDTFASDDTAEDHGIAPDWALLNYLLANRACVIVEAVSSAADASSAPGNDEDDPFSDSLGGSSSKSMAKTLAKGVVSDRSLLSFLSDSGGILLFEGAGELVDIASRILLDPVAGLEERNSIGTRGQQLVEQLQVSGNLRAQLDKILPLPATRFAQRLVEALQLVQEFEYHESMSEEDEESHDAASSSGRLALNSFRSFTHRSSSSTSSLTSSTIKRHQQRHRHLALLERATSLLQTLVRDAPKAHAAHLALGRALHLLDRNKDAEKHLKKALKLATNVPEIYEVFGEVSQALEFIEDARDYFQAAVETIEENEAYHSTSVGICPIGPLIQLADVYVQLSEYESLVKTISRLMECAPANREALSAFAWASIELEIPENVDWVIQQLSNIEGTEKEILELEKAIKN